MNCVGGGTGADALTGGSLLEAPRIPVLKSQCSCATQRAYHACDRRSLADADVSLEPSARLGLCLLGTPIGRGLLEVVVYRPAAPASPCSSLVRLISYSLVFTASSTYASKSQIRPSSSDLYSIHNTQS